jgi:hypothetical protein
VADDDLDPQVRAQILRLKAPPLVQVKPRKHLGRLSADVSTLVPRDIKFFGGKASNFGLLRRRSRKTHHTQSRFPSTCGSSFSRT